MTDRQLAEDFGRDCVNAVLYARIESDSDALLLMHAAYINARAAGHYATRYLDEAWWRTS